MCLQFLKFQKVDEITILENKMYYEEFIFLFLSPGMLWHDRHVPRDADGPGDGRLGSSWTES